MLKNNNEIIGNEELSADDYLHEEENKIVNFTVGQDIQVTPTSFADYGVFCDCGNGYTGLLHISRVTSKFVKSFSEYFEIGKPFTARIIEIHNDKKISLSTKEFNLEPKNSNFNNDKQGGFNKLENNLNSWVKKDSNN